MGLRENHVNTGYEVSDILAGFVDTYSHGTNYGHGGNAELGKNGHLRPGRLAHQTAADSELGLAIRHTHVGRSKWRTARQTLTSPQERLLLAGQKRQLAQPGQERLQQLWATGGFRLSDYKRWQDRPSRRIWSLLFRRPAAAISNQLAQNPPFSGQNSVSYSNGLSHHF